MSVTPVIPSISANSSANKLKLNQKNVAKNNNVSFGGTNFIVDSMDFIGKGGFAAAFCIQDGIGFIFPRVYEGLTRGSKKKDENGNPVLDENGKQVREYNWALARKELLRELITGPSAFVIPWLGLKAINKYAPANNVKLNYINGFNNAFTDFANANLNEIKSGTPSKVGFYQNVFKEVLDKTFNNKPLPLTRKLSIDEVESIAQEYAQRQVKIEEILADKSLSKAQRAEKIAEVGGSIEDSFMKLKKSKIGGAVDELAITMKSTDGTLKNGSIGELLGSMNSYFNDAVKSTKNALTKNPNADLADIIKSFTGRRMGTRVMTNLGLFGLVAAFYTQIPKIYNAGQKGNPGLKGTAADPSAMCGAETKKDSVDNKTNGKEPSFGGLGGIMEKTGNAVFNNKAAKKVSDIFELNGPVISGMAMPVLLYGFCIPPRLEHAQDKYDYGEVILRDMTSFTTLLFGAKALSRLFSDWFTKLTGLALNSKNLEGRNVFQRVIDYLNPSDGRHAVLSSKQLDSKYTNLEDYKGGVNGFVEFIEMSGGNIKKAFTRDKDVQACVEEILKDVNGKSFADASVAEIKDALKTANANKSDLIKKFYKLFEGQNGLLKAAKTCNSTFNFLSTFAITPGIIIALTQICKKMTERRTAQDLAAQAAKNTQVQSNQNLNFVATNAPTMAGFLNK